MFFKEYFVNIIVTFLMHMYKCFGNIVCKNIHAYLKYFDMLKLWQYSSHSSALNAVAISDIAATQLRSYRALGRKAWRVTIPTSRLWRSETEKHTHFRR